MFIYNVTVTIEESIHEEWLKWMKNVHVPDVMRTGIFVTHRICRVITDTSEITYSVQYTFRSMADMQRYQEEFAPRLQKEHSERFKDKFAAFRTFLEIIE